MQLFNREARHDLSAPIRYRAKGLKGVCSLLRIGRGLRSIKKDPPDGLLSHEDLWFGAGDASSRTAEETITLIVRM